jgi:hypothetical protein
MMRGILRFWGKDRWWGADAFVILSHKLPPGIARESGPTLPDARLDASTGHMMSCQQDLVLIGRLGERT